MSGVARGLQLQTSNVSTADRSLVERGLLDRASDPNDQCRTLVTSSARAMLAGLLEALGELDGTHLRAASQALERMAWAMEVGRGRALRMIQPAGVAQW